MTESRWGAVNPPFTQPPACVDWGEFFRAMCSVFREREVAEICEAVEAVLEQTHVVFQGEPSLEVPLPGDRMVSVGYVTSVDRDGFVRCTVTRVRVVGATIAA